VLVMDEATASIDYMTDAKIQAAIRNLRNTTIITIAHRLQTVIDYDKILILDQGKVVEFEHPHTLLKKSRGLFKEMCQQSEHFEELQLAAKIAYKDSRLVDYE
jgi:ABC-type multidrug transport system fused ATPase/permease subunit